MGWLKSWISLLVLLALWTAISMTAATNNRLFPTPYDVATAFWAMLVSGELIPDIIASSRRAFVGFVIGGLFGVALGYATARSNTFDAIFGGVFQILRPLPPISLVPLFILWFGINEPSKYLMVSFGVFFPVWISTHLGIRTLDQRYIWMAQSLGATKASLAFEVILPAALPIIISGLRTSIGVAFFCLVAAELAGALDGVVFRMNLSQLSFRVDRLMAGLLVLGGLSSLSDFMFIRFVSRAFPWLKGLAVGREANRP